MGDPQWATLHECSKMIRLHKALNKACHTVLNCSVYINDFVQIFPSAFLENCVNKHVLSCASSIIQLTVLCAHAGCVLWKTLVHYG